MATMVVEGASRGKEDLQMDIIKEGASRGKEDLQMDIIKEGASRGKEDVQMDIINPFSSAYVRNNKSKTKKNMRCFPQCCESGHNMKGFCGMPIRMRVSSVVCDKEQLGSLMVLGGIQCNKKKVACTIGTEIHETKVTEFCETNELIQGTTVAHCGEFSGMYVISPGTRKSWNYAWNTDNCRGRVCHFFSAFCFRQSSSNPGFLECVGSCTSRGFEVCCSKRSARGTTPGTVKTKPLKKRLKALPSTLPLFIAPLPNGQTVPVTTQKQLHIQQLQQLQCELQQMYQLQAQVLQPTTQQLRQLQQLQQFQLQQQLLLQLQQQQQQQQQQVGFAPSSPHTQIYTSKDATPHVGDGGNVCTADAAKAAQPKHLPYLSAKLASIACPTIPSVSVSSAYPLIHPLPVEGTVVSAGEEIKMSATM
jgi:hypothetical protein